MLSKLRRFWSGEKGAVAIIFAASFMPMILVIGASVDLVRSITARNALQASVDAAALSAATSLAKKKKIDDEQAIKIVDTYIKTNNSINSIGLFDIETVITPDIKKTAASTITVHATAKLETTFMKVVNIDSMTINASTVAQQGGLPPMHLALVLDVTGSMNEPLGLKSKLEVLKLAALDLMDKLDMVENSTDVHPETRIGIVPYSGTVRLYAAGKQPDPAPNWIRPRTNGKIKWNGCIGPRVFELDGTTFTKAYLETIANPTAPPYPGMPSDMPNCPPAVLLPLTNDWTTVRTTINDLKADGTTYIPSGLTWGWNMLDKNGPFDLPSLTAQGGQKVMVLMTDGENYTGVRSPDGYMSMSPLPPSDTRPDVNARTSALCQKIKDSGITLFTVAFALDAVEARKMLNDCATSTDMAFVANDQDGLVRAFQEIADKLRTVKIVK